MRLSVVVPCFNAVETLGDQLDALTAQQWDEPWEVVIADNGSTDGSLELARAYAERRPRVRVVDASGRRGASHARNEGVRATRGEALAFCDADDEVATGWVAAMGKALAVHDFVAGRFEWEKLNEPWMLACRHVQPSALIAYGYPPYYPFVATGNLGVKRVLHEAIGGFDESLLRLQDADYSWRLQLAGVRPQLAADAVVHGRVRGSLQAVLRQEFRKAEYGVRLYTLYRTRGMPKIAWRNGLRAWRALVTGFPRAMRDERSRIAWAHELAWRSGRLRGCIKHRTLAF